LAFVLWAWVWGGVAIDCSDTDSLCGAILMPLSMLMSVVVVGVVVVVVVGVVVGFLPNAAAILSMLGWFVVLVALSRAAAILSMLLGSFVVVVVEALSRAAAILSMVEPFVVVVVVVEALSRAAAILSLLVLFFLCKFLFFLSLGCLPLSSPFFFCCTFSPCLDFFFVICLVCLVLFLSMLCLGLLLELLDLGDVLSLVW